MAQFRYTGAGSWRKGNTHIHSTVSDGGQDFKQLERMYADAGYDFLFRTDHWAASNVAADNGASPLLWLDGIELDGPDYAGSYYHIVCLGRFTGITREMGFTQALMEARRQGGLLILAHPDWMGNSFEEASRYGVHGVEVYNHVCRWLNGKGDGSPYWHALLDRNPDTIGLAVDDAHIKPEHPGWNGGWIQVDSPQLTADGIVDSIRSGRFYSSCGPEIQSMEFDGEQLHVTTSPVQFVRLVGPSWRGHRIGSFNGDTRTETSLSVPLDWRYVYLEVEDSCGRRAWTNSLFVPEA